MAMISTLASRSSARPCRYSVAARSIICEKFHNQGCTERRKRTEGRWRRRNNHASGEGTSGEDVRWAYVSNHRPIASLHARCNKFRIDLRELCKSQNIRISHSYNQLQHCNLTKCDGSSSKGTIGIPHFSVGIINTLGTSTGRTKSQQCDHTYSTRHSKKRRIVSTVAAQYLEEADNLNLPYSSSCGTHIVNKSLLQAMGCRSLGEAEEIKGLESLWCKSYGHQSKINDFYFQNEFKDFECKKSGSKVACRENKNADSSSSEESFFGVVGNWPRGH